jgi:hypothetical protein
MNEHKNDTLAARSAAILSEISATNIAQPLPLSAEQMQRICSLLSDVANTKLPTPFGEYWAQVHEKTNAVVNSGFNRLEAGEPLSQREAPSKNAGFVIITIPLYAEPLPSAGGDNIPEYERIFQSGITDLVMRHITRMNDICKEDPAERILDSFIDQFNPMFETYLQSKFPNRPPTKSCPRTPYYKAPKEG